MNVILNKQNAEQGLSLIELLIGMTLGLMLMGGALHVFMNSKQSFAFSTESTVMQESARYIMEVLTSDMRMAGYFGCGSQSIAVTLKPASGANAWAYDFDKGLVGYDGDDASYPTATFPVATRPTLASGALPKSDAFTILRGNTDSALKVEGHNASSAVIDLNVNHGYSDGHIMAVSNCDHAAVFQTNGGNPKKLGHNKGNSEIPGNCTKGLGLPVTCTANGIGYEYGKDAYVMEVMSHAYYVTNASNGIPSLYRKRILGGLTASAETEELAQGVENIQLVFGVDTNNDEVANRYVTANNVTDWTMVTSVRIHVLLRSISAVTSEAVAFRFAGTSYTPTDKFLRREFTSTISIRN